MKNILYSLIIISIVLFLIGCTDEEKDNRNQTGESTLTEEQIHDIYFIRKAPKATKTHKLSEVIKVVATSSNGKAMDTIAIDIQNNVFHIDPWISTAGVTALDESEHIKDIEKVIDLLEKYHVQDWKEDYSSEKDAASTDDGVGWSLYLQFEDGTVEKHKGMGTLMEVITPEGFDDFYEALETFVSERLGDAR